MTVFHRFYAIFPLFVLLLALTGCAAQPWQPAGKKLPQASADGGDIYMTSPQSVIPSDPNSVKIAILLPLSGQNAALGQSMLQAAQLAIFDLGYDRVELMPKDTASGAGAAASSAIADGAKLILGPLFAEDVRSVKAATKGRGINVIAFSTDWTVAGGNTYMMGFLPFGQVDRITSYAASKGLKRAAVASGADTYAQTAVSRFEQAAKQNGMSVNVALSDPAAYDSVFIPAGGTALSNILPRVNNKAARKLGTGLWDDARVAADPAMNGAWFAAPSATMRLKFEERYQSTYGARPSRLSSIAYDATALAVTLAKSGMASSGKPAFDSASLTNPNGFSGIDGILRFNNQNLAERGTAILEIRQGRIAEIDPAPTSFR